MSGFDSLLAAAGELIGLAQARGLHLASAESCTGGLIAGCLTEIPGSSNVFDRGFVTYSNAAKSELLGVAGGLIARSGAVSEEVARAMAEGALKASNADLAIAVTGIAGPGGAKAGKPIGLVHLACARRGGKTGHVREIFPGDRAAVRQATVAKALAMLKERIAAGD